VFFQGIQVYEHVIQIDVVLERLLKSGVLRNNGYKYKTWE
jgi:hypothetical protein